MPAPRKTVLGLGVGCGCAALAFGLLMVGVVYLSCSNFFGQMMGERTYQISGDVRRFDPFAKLGEVRTRVGTGARLVSIRADFVRSDGTMDLEAKYSPWPQTTYIFRRPLDKAPENAPPLGAGRGPDDVWFEEIRVSCYKPGQLRSVSRTSGGVRTQYTYTHLGMDVDAGSPQSGKLEEGLPDPKCSTQELWEMALAKGADKEAVARIEYDEDGFSFRIDKTQVRFECDLECQEKGR